MTCIAILVLFIEARRASEDADREELVRALRVAMAAVIVLAVGFVSIGHDIFVADMLAAVVVAIIAEPLICLLTDIEPRLLRGAWRDK